MPVKRKQKIEPIPKSFPTLEAAGEFWDTHDLADYWDQTRPIQNVTFKIERRRFLVSLEPSLAENLHRVARARGISSETLLHLWLNEKLQETRNKA